MRLFVAVACFVFVLLGCVTSSREASGVSVKRSNEAHPARATPTPASSRTKAARSTYRDELERAVALSTPAERLAALGALRVKLWQAHALNRPFFSDSREREEYELKRINQHLPPQLPSPLVGDDLAVLRATHHLRAALLLDEKRPAEALTELVGWWRSKPSLFTACGADEPDCIRVRDQLNAAYPGFCVPVSESVCGQPEKCPPECGAVYTQKNVPTWQSASGPSQAFVQVTPEKVTKQANGTWLVTGHTVPISEQTDCKGRFETDRIVGVSQTRIEVERTTWCTEIRKYKVKGEVVRFVLPAGPRPAEVFTLFLDLKARTRRVEGAFNLVTFDQVVLLSHSALPTVDLETMKRLSDLYY